MAHFRAVLFDFDGTLAHLTIDFAKMRRLVLAELADILGKNSPVLTRDDLPVMELVYAASKEQPAAVQNEISRRSEQVVSAYELEAAANTRLFPYVRDLLKSLNRQGIASGIVTRNCRAAVAKVFPDHATLCGVLVSRNDVRPEALKPNPGQLLTAVAILGCKPHEAIMVGDHPLDVLAGKAAGCRTAGVLTGNASRADMHVASPDWLSDDVDNLFRELKLYQ